MQELDLKVQRSFYLSLSLMKQISDYADAEGISFNKAVERLTSKGLQAVKNEGKTKIATGLK